MTQISNNVDVEVEVIISNMSEQPVEIIGG